MMGWCWWLSSMTGNSGHDFCIEFLLGVEVDVRETRKSDISYSLSARLSHPWKSSELFFFDAFIIGIWSFMSLKIPMSFMSFWAISQSLAGINAVPWWIHGAIRGRERRSLQPEHRPVLQLLRHRQRCFVTFGTFFAEVARHPRIEKSLDPWWNQMALSKDRGKALISWLIIMFHIFEWHSFFWREKYGPWISFVSASLKPKSMAELLVSPQIGHLRPICQRLKLYKNALGDPTLKARQLIQSCPKPLWIEASIRGRTWVIFTYFFWLFANAFANCLCQRLPCFFDCIWSVGFEQLGGRWICRRLSCCCEDLCIRSVSRKSGS